MVQHSLHFPTGALGQSVEHLWVVRGSLASPLRQMLLPDGAVTLMVNLGEPQRLCDRADVSRGTLYRRSWVSGQQPGPIVIQHAGRCHLAGIRFRPGGAAALFRFPVTELTGQVIELEDIWREEGQRLREELAGAADDADTFRILRCWLESRLSGPDRRVSFAAAMLQRGGTGVGRLAAEMGFSHRHLVQIFSHQVGLNPKLFGRVHRLQRVIQKIGLRRSIDWAEEADAAGYFDQPHLVRDFRELAGLTPTEFLARRGPYAGYLNVA
ncbi:MAG TPA: helix-turn-helix domain-containing protein [Candidatus Didemnitutus sp.]|nr:helix-turn-helix domain-containing protein [Candidatus Didemnitutus sp.]